MAAIVSVASVMAAKWLCARQCWAALFPPAAAIAVIGGAFKRGGDAILPQGMRFVVYVQRDSKVAVSVEP